MNGHAARFAAATACVFLFVLPVAHTVAIRTTALALAALAAAWLWQRERAPAPPRSVMVALAAWAGIAAISLLWTIDFEYSQGEMRNEVVYPLIAFFTFHVLTRGETAWRLWVRVLAASAALVAIYAFFNFIRHADWYTRAYVGDRNAYSTYATLVAPVLFAALLDRGLGARWRAVAAVALVLTLGAGALTQNRAMWVALFVAALVLLATRFRWRATSPGARIAALAAVLTLGVAGGAQIAVSSYTKGLAPNAPSLGARLQGDPRFEIWAYAVERAAERPWLGYGYGRGIVRKDFRARFPDTPLNWHGHNLFLNTALGGGIVLVAALVALLAALAYSLWREARGSPACAVALAVLAAAIVKSLTDDVLIRENSLLLWSLAGMALGVAARGRPAAP